MDRKEAEQAVFICQICGDDVHPEIADAPESELGYTIDAIECPRCGVDMRGDEASTEELLGI